MNTQNNKPIVEMNVIKCLYIFNNYIYIYLIISFN